jgi:hypothetical protein
LLINDRAIGDSCLDVVATKPDTTGTTPMILGEKKRILGIMINNKMQVGMDGTFSFGSEQTAAGDKNEHEQIRDHTRSMVLVFDFFLNIV